MRTLCAILLLTMTACSHIPKKSPSIQLSSPTGGEVVGDHVNKATVSIEKAKAKAHSIRQQLPNNIDVQELQNDLNSTSLELSSAQSSLTLYKNQVLKQTDFLNKSLEEKNKAIEQAEYWHSKQMQAVGKLWFWRFVAGIGWALAAGYVAFRIWKGLAG